MRILIVANTAWYINNFRMNLMQTLKEENNVIFTAASKDENTKDIKESGFDFIEWNVKGSSINPINEAYIVWQLFRIIKKNKIDVVLAYTPKGNIYGAYAAMFARVKIVNNISGLGRVFVQHGLITSFVKKLYKFSLGRSYKVYFQNQDDMDYFLEHRIVRRELAERIPGSGVDVQRFSPKKVNCDVLEKRRGDEIVFLLIARLIWDKGIGEYVEAARRIKSNYPHCRFQILGFLKADNPAAISADTIQVWVDEGVIEYLGSAKDVAPIVAASDCVVLPSYYREGVPRSLLEAASAGKPIITTDSTGCRDTVDEGVTGFLCTPRDAKDLANKMEQFLNLDKKIRKEMGMRGRQKMEKEFDESIVIGCYLELLRRSSSNLN